MKPTQLKPLGTPAKMAETIADIIERQVIGNLKPGDRLPTLRSLSKQLKVSVSTLQSAMAVLHQRGLVESRQGSGIYVASPPPTSSCIGILSELDLLDSRISPHFRELANALRLRFAEIGIDTQLYVGQAEPGPGRSDQPTCPQFWTDVKAGKLTGAVIVDTPATDPWYFRLKDCPIPLVGSLTGYEVEVDFDGVVRLAVRRLAEQGCQRLGLLAWHDAPPFLETVQLCGAATCDAWVKGGLDPAVRGAGWEEFREIWSASQGRPDGLVILDDMLFADAQLAIFELGVRVPQDLRVATLVSRDASAPVRLPATIIEIDPVERANGLVEMLMQRMRGELMQPVTHRLSFRELEFQPGEEAANTENGRKETHKTQKVGA